MSPTSYQAALPRVIPSLLSATLIIIPYSNGFVKRVRKVFFAAEAEDENAAADLLSRKPAATPIHAPPREATKRKRLCTGHQPISIHAPPRGATAKDMQFLQIFCSTLTNQHGLTIVPRNLSRLFW